MANYNLKKLVNYFGVLPQYIDTLTSYPFIDQNITRLQLDSRQIMAGDLFIALKGQSSDGRDFIEKSIKAGAIAVLADAELAEHDKTLTYHLVDGKKILQINIYQLANKISAFANTFYDNPSEKMNVVGITGTNGKTTVSQIIAQWATLIGEKSAIIGTIGNGIYGHLRPSVNTTPSSVDIQSHLADFLTQSVTIVAMEVSSHGLALGRVSDVTFSASLFTNLSRDHLDFHYTMDNYNKAKWSLFSPLNDELAVKSSGKRVINFDDNVGLSWINQLDDVVVVTCIPDNLTKVQALGKRYIAVSSVSYHDQGASIIFESSFGTGILQSRLFGAFNVSNLLLAFAALLSLNYSFSALVNSAGALLPINGRMEIFTVKGKPTVIVDYAHTPDALDKALIAASTHCNGKLWVIFGCGGDRDRGKRPLMAQVAQSHTNNIIITNDNPRTENEDLIINDIVNGFIEFDNIKIIKDRTSAIQWAIEHANYETDIILVAGKGHEDYQIIGNTKHYYSDRETVSHFLGTTI
ncbi:UDP-N-acetylmuramoyl-L-alanyl-D-glutamate--2,6-diaminopimelate ligase [Orbus wheelerorum]|uniref:UDP-N-acetylmuramoyl-L-alanyl-D-glutamate--2, 6-diaminopimelate ligase n=1 Tax=Orbus wheelerorum TaxID=3074111 RepID=UPI00370D2280